MSLRDKGRIVDCDIEVKQITWFGHYMVGFAVRGS